MEREKELDADLARLREELKDLDAQLLGIVAARQEISVRVGAVKQELGEGTRDFEQERDVIERARRLGRSLALPEPLCDKLLSLLIQSSLTTQERQRIAGQRGGDGRRVLVIGGAGKMGQWFARFLDSQGFDIEISDPADGEDEYPNVGNWDETELDHDIIVVAAQIRESAGILESLLSRRPPGLILDISSLKSPMRQALRRLAGAGLKVSSIHPMFGPDTDLLSGRHVIFIDLGVAEAQREARDLFASTMAELVEMDLEDHDRLIAYVLGLSHALNLAFATALAESGEDAPRLAQLSSTTFDAQLAVASHVAGDNPHLYFEIQSLNDYGTESLSALLGAVERLKSVVETGNESGFVRLMEKGLHYLRSRRRQGES